MPRTKHVAFTLVELLVVIAIIGVLVSMLLPAIQACREAARRSSCSNNMAQLIMAVQNYESAHLAFPSGVENPTGPIRNEPKGIHLSWIVSILPFIEEQNTFNAIDRALGTYAAKNQPARNIPISILSCPSYAGDVGQPPISNYAGCYHDVEAPIDTSNNGVFYLNSRTRLRDISDGSSHTIFLGETSDDLKLYRNLGWMSGTRATLRNTGTLPNQGLYTGKGTLPPPILAEASFVDYRYVVDGADPTDIAPDESPLPPEPEETLAVADENGVPYDLLWVGGFGSDHSGDLIMVAFGDGRVTTLSSIISPAVFQQLGHRADGKLLTERDEIY